MTITVAFPSHGDAVVREPGPLEEAAADAAVGLVADLTHPHVPSARGPLFLHHLQHARGPAATLGRVSWPKFLAVPAVGDVDAFVGSERVRRYCCRGRDAVFPFLLHLRVHHEQRVVRQVNCDLP